MKGRVEVGRIASSILRDNPLRDPWERDLAVYVPPSYDRSPHRRYPTIYYLVGFTGTGASALNAHPWKESLAERLDRLILSRAAADCVLVLPDCFTRYGGSQYVNSPATGRYEDYLIREVVPTVDRRFRTIRHPAQRCVMGKSSGGYGALSLGMRHPEVFGHVVSHSGDMFFELCYGMDFPKCVNALARYGGSFARFVRAFDSAPPRARGAFPHELVNMAGMASCYSPDAKSPRGCAIPFEESTGAVVEETWDRWVRRDPVRMASRYARNLKKLRTLFFDAGTKDEYYLHLGARRFSRELKRLGVRHVYEEHGGGHFDLADRCDVSLKKVSAAFRGSPRPS